MITKNEAATPGQSVPVENHDVQLAPSNAGNAARVGRSSGGLAQPR